MTLLRQLGADGAPMFQHADFDPAGIAITAWLQERAGTQPWLMTAKDYLRGARSPDAAFGSVPDTPWDLALQTIMAEHRAALYEEDIRDELLSSALKHPTP